jgi:energy-converting hydrogenase Eha subunit C
VAVAYPILSLVLRTDYLDLWDAVAAAALGGLTTIAVFLGVSYLLRAPELRDLMRRG